MALESQTMLRRIAVLDNEKLLCAHKLAKVQGVCAGIDLDLRYESRRHLQTAEQLEALFQAATSHMLALADQRVKHAAVAEAEEVALGPWAVQQLLADSNVSLNGADRAAVFSSIALRSEDWLVAAEAGYRRELQELAAALERQHAAAGRAQREKAEAEAENVRLRRALAVERALNDRLGQLEQRKSDELQAMGVKLQGVKLEDQARRASMRAAVAELQQHVNLVQQTVKKTLGYIPHALIRPGW